MARAVNPMRGIQMSLRTTPLIDDWEVLMAPVKVVRMKVTLALLRRPSQTPNPFLTMGSRDNDNGGHVFCKKF